MRTIFILAVAIFIASFTLGQSSNLKERPDNDEDFNSIHDRRIFELDREALDNAYRERIERLFAIWLSDHSGQPQRAATGARIARKAYLDAQRKLDERERK
jgi:hypothetical protein